MALRSPASRTLLRKLTATTTQFVRHHSSSSSSVSADELSHFSALASSWWDPMGPSRVLHLMNPLRHEFIASCLAECPPQPAQRDTELEGSTTTSTTTKTSEATDLKYLDVGCGGGIFAESLARTIPLSPSTTTTNATRAASIIAIDPSPTLIQIARDHARTDPAVDSHLRSGTFQYRNTTLEGLVAEENENGNENGIPITNKEKFDVVTLFEVLEHIDPATSSPLTFLTNCLRLLRPGGWLIGSTIARSLPSFLVNQVIAEAPWPVGVVPRGTHEWKKFVNPDELKGWVKEGLVRVRARGSKDGKDGAAATTAGGSEVLKGMKWKCSGVMYFPGLGWRIVGGSESWGNYFWAVRRGV